jgi:hypothetical protein
MGINRRSIALLIRFESVIDCELSGKSHQVIDQICEPFMALDHSSETGMNGPPISLLMTFESEIDCDLFEDLSRLIDRV